MQVSIDGAFVLHVQGLRFPGFGQQKTKQTVKKKSRKAFLRKVLTPEFNLSTFSKDRTSPQPEQSKIITHPLINFKDAHLPVTALICWKDHSLYFLIQLLFF